MTVLICIFICVIIAFTTYKIIEANATTIEYTELFVLKNELNKKWAGAAKHKFNLIGEIPGLMGDKVFIEKVETFVWGKLKKFEIRIQQSNMDDCDEYF